jgi:hypothetical protein
MVTQNYDTASKSKERLLVDIDEFDGWLSGYKSLIQEAEIDHSEDPRGAALEVVETIQQELFLRVLRE